MKSWPKACYWLPAVLKSFDSVLCSSNCFNYSNYFNYLNYFNYCTDLSDTSPSCPTRTGRPAHFPEKLTAMTERKIIGRWQSVADGARPRAQKPRNNYWARLSQRRITFLMRLQPRPNRARPPLRPCDLASIRLSRLLAVIRGYLRLFAVKFLTKEQAFQFHAKSTTKTKGDHSMP